MSIATSASLDMRGKTITTFIACGAAERLAAMADGQALELLTDPGDDIDNDIRAWCRASGLDLVSADRADGTCQYVITRQPPRRSGRRLAAVISDPGLEELLSPLGFALAGALEGIDVALYFRGPRSVSWPRASPRSCTGRADHSAGSPARGSPRPGTSRRRRK